MSGFSQGEVDDFFLFRSTQPTGDSKDFGVERMELLADAAPIVILLYTGATVFADAATELRVREQSGDGIGKGCRFIGDENLRAVFEV